MADLSITAASVLPSGSSDIERGVAGTTLTAGQPVYLEAATQTLKLSDNNGATAEIKTVKGITLNGASAGQPVDIHKGGDLTLGAVLTAGTAYYLSGTAGSICPRADITTGMNVVHLGIAKSTSVLNVRLQDVGVAL